MFAMNIYLALILACNPVICFNEGFSFKAIPKAARTA
jgi:hypothetical protein